MGGCILAPGWLQDWVEDSFPLLRILHDGVWVWLLCSLCKYDIKWNIFSVQNMVYMEQTEQSLEAEFESFAPNACVSCVSGSQYLPKSYQRATLTARKRFQVALWYHCFIIMGLLEHGKPWPHHLSLEKCRNKYYLIYKLTSLTDSRRWQDTQEKHKWISNLVLNTWLCKENKN